MSVPWARPNSGFTLLFEAYTLPGAKQIPVLAARRLLQIPDGRLWLVFYDCYPARADPGKASQPLRWELTVTREHLHGPGREREVAARTAPTVFTVPPRSLKEQVADLERRAIEEALKEAAGNKTLAARRLGITRQRLIQMARRVVLRREAASARDHAGVTTLAARSMPNN